MGPGRDSESELRAHGEPEPEAEVAEVPVTGTVPVAALPVAAAAALAPNFHTLCNRRTVTATGTIMILKSQDQDIFGERLL